jgi:hypothetical protein
MKLSVNGHLTQSRSRTLETLKTAGGCEPGDGKSISRSYGTGGQQGIRTDKEILLAFYNQSLYILFDEPGASSARIIFRGIGWLMKRLLAAVALMGWVAAGAAQAGGLSPSVDKEVTKPGVIVADVLEVKAVLEAIDPKKRILTLKERQGRSLALKADKAVKNFDSLRKGDVVLADFVESIAIFIRKADTPPSAAEARLVSVAPKGSNRGVLLAETFQVTAVVESIDVKSRLVTIKEPDRSARIVPVDKGFKNLAGIKKGDEVILRVTEAIAIKIEKRK